MDLEQFIQKAEHEAELVKPGRALANPAYEDWVYTDLSWACNTPTIVNSSIKQAATSYYSNDAAEIRKLREENAMLRKSRTELQDAYHNLCKLHADLQATVAQANAQVEAINVGTELDKAVRIINKLRARVQTMRERAKPAPTAAPREGIKPAINGLLTIR